MEPKRRVQHVGVEVNAGKDERWRNRKWLDKKEKGKVGGLSELELQIRMDVGLIENTGGKVERGNAKNNIVGEAAKGRKMSDGLRMGTGDRMISAEEKVHKEGAWKNEVQVDDFRGGNVIMKRPPKEESGCQLDVSDYLLLLKSLHITLPKGVLSPEVIALAQNADIILKAQDIVKELENFKLQFNSTPRLTCREVKESLALKAKGNVLEITEMIFFEKRKDSEVVLKTKWRENVPNTACRFRFRNKYKTTAISIPAMYATVQTRSWAKLQVGDDCAGVLEGVKVNVHTIENTEYCDESALWSISPSPKRFGKYFQNPADESECLKFFHELGEIGTNQTVRYTRSNKVDFGFLTGKLDYLSEVKNQKGSRANINGNEEKSEKIVIECKGTTGDMVGKLFIKPKNGSRRAQLNEAHEYYYQVQAYMYILNSVAKQTQAFTSDRAVMVIRHYHKNGSVPRDFYWSYLSMNDRVQQQIDELRVFCQTDVLACFLAVLNLIFQKEP